MMLIFHLKFDMSTFSYQSRFIDFLNYFFRYQCCPLYKVRYSNPRQCVDNVTGNKEPPFSWLSVGISADFNKSIVDSTWSLHAKTVFEEIEIKQGLEPITMRSTTPTRKSLDGKLSLLKKLGFIDVELNLKTLKENDYNTERCVRLLLQRNINDDLKARLQNAFKPTEDKSESESEGSSYHSSTDEDEPKERRPTPKDTSRKRKPNKTLRTEPLDEDCSICCNKYAKTSEHWKELECRHKLCVNCFEKIQITRTTMTGLSHTFMKCPFCLVTSGIEIGICPNGEMSERVIRSHCDGYEDWFTILIQYKVKTTVYRVKRFAFLPDNEEGRNILKLLRIAWDRRVILTIGTSHTTGIENSLVWNIHHKTSQSGGVYCHGYPDPTYFERVLAELKSFGIQ